MKMPAKAAIITVKGDQQLARAIEKAFSPEAANISGIDLLPQEVAAEEEERKIKKEQDRKNTKVERKDADNAAKPIQPDEETKSVLLDKLVLGQSVIIGTSLTPSEEKRLLCFLLKNKDVFAWSSRDLEGVSRQVIEHELEMDPTAKPKKQKL